MLKINEVPAIKTTEATKDAGRVKIGGGCMHFGDVTPATKDAGRVKIGGGCMQF